MKLDDFVEEKSQWKFTEIKQETLNKKLFFNHVTKYQIKIQDFST